MALPRMNTNEKDVEQFASERQTFLVESQRLKLGMLPNGLLALNTLESMYQVLLSSDHQAKDQGKDAAAYIKELADFRAEFTTYLKKKETEAPHEVIHDPKFLPLIIKFDAVVYKFYKIKAELGRSG